MRYKFENFQEEFISKLRKRTFSCFVCYKFRLLRVFGVMSIYQLLLIAGCVVYGSTNHVPLFRLESRHGTIKEEEPAGKLFIDERVIVFRVSNNMKLYRSSTR